MKFSIIKKTRFGIIVLIIISLLLINFHGAIKVNQQNSFCYNGSTDSIIVLKDIKIKDYFSYIDSIVKKHNLTSEYNLTEHILVRNNHWIIDTLMNTDYYRRMERDSFVYNQKEMIVLRKGSKIEFPNLKTAAEIQNTIDNTRIEINIPEYRLRIYEGSLKLYDFPIRVGRNERKYLKMGDRITDLRTKTGKGKIVNYVRDPDYYNPVDGRQYYLTVRDDKRITKLPQIPWIETEINGIRYGQLIHPTTNPKTLSKAYSNGCIGTKEADAWVVYYYASIGTSINISYNLIITNNKGEKVELKDIYGFEKNKNASNLK